MTSEVGDVLTTVQALVGKGYDREYRVKDGQLIDLKLGSRLNACDIQVDTALRLESGEDAGDVSNIYAITDPATQHKGLLIDAFDVFDELCSRDLSEKLTETRQTAVVQDGDVPSKHGLRKVFKSEFESDPERYVLSEGFPDFPACPFGGEFSILGFDTAEQTYVWLVTSIIRDPRLIRIPYQGPEATDDDGFDPARSVAADAS